MKLLRLLSLPILTVAMGTLVGCGGYNNSVLVNRTAGVASPTKATLGQGAKHQTTGQPVSYKIVSHSDSMRRHIVVAGGPEDKGGGELADLWIRDPSLEGSILGFRVNQAMTAKVASGTFQPKILVLERLTQWPTSDKPEFYVAAVCDGLVSSGGGININICDYRLQKDNKRDGVNITGIVFAVLSGDGKTGDYSIQIENKN